MPPYIIYLQKKERNRLLFLGLFNAVVDIVAFCWLHVLLKVGDAALDEDVIPLDELFDVAVVHTLAVEFGQNLGKVLAQFLTTGLAEIYTAGLAVLKVAHIGENLPKGHIFRIGVHCDICKRGDAVGCKCWYSLMGMSSTWFGK